MHGYGVTVQNEADSLMTLMFVFNMESGEDYESQVAKVSAVYDLNRKYIDWCEFKVKVTHNRRLVCTK